MIRTPWCRGTGTSTLLLAACIMTSAPIVPAGVLSGQATAGTRAEDPPLFTWRDAAMTGTLAAATVLLWQKDRSIANWVNDSSQRNNTLDDISISLRKVNERSAFAASLGVYAVGRLAGRPRLADGGLHATEAVLFTAGVQTLLKNAFGRSRPFVTNHQQAFDLNPGKGFSDPWYRSMPSLHTGGMFAAAVVMVGELERRSPGRGKFIAPVAYAVALSPGIARMYDDRHWATDVLVGSATGYWVGKKTLRYHHPPSGHRRRIDRWLLGTTIAPAADGGAMLVVRQEF